VLTQLQLHVFAAVITGCQRRDMRATTSGPSAQRGGRAAAAQVRVAFTCRCKARARASPALPFRASAACNEMFGSAHRRQSDGASAGAPGNRLAHDGLQLQSFSQKFPSAMHEHVPTLQLPSQLHGLNCAQTCGASFSMSQKQVAAVLPRTWSSECAIRLRTVAVARLRDEAAALPPRARRFQRPPRPLPWAPSSSSSSRPASPARKRCDT